MRDPNKGDTGRRNRFNRTVRFFMIVVALALVVRVIIFLIDDGAQMTPEEGAKLPAVETPAPVQ